MTTLIDRVEGVAVVGSYCKLGTFFVMPLRLPILRLAMLIFEKISLQGALEKFDKNRELHKRSLLCNTQSLTDFSRTPL